MRTNFETSDRELLKLAAKAAGIDLSHFDKDEKKMVVFAIDGDENPDQTYWNPLIDDGDALRLAVKLRMTVDVDLWHDTVQIRAYSEPNMYHIDEHGEINSATRRAIVRAAAEIGKGERNADQIVSDREFEVQKATIAQQAERIAELERREFDWARSNAKCTDHISAQSAALAKARDALADIHPGNMTPLAEESWREALAAIAAQKGTDNEC